ncbi:MAG: LpxL/LpxP family Kdo(2)-lipid IV(A) lauroyl/palmitoleoyl acyltransferase [Coxiellaceae bacterium]|nr:LpxL/LpxP family Kdo(2)-lipid IV(A) lauroyl/palmitoleoyl acyltransferase [Coxiellaceae bacterium]
MVKEVILSKSWYHFLAPRYWMMWIAIGLLRLSAFLPYSILLFLGKNSGRLVMRVWRERRIITAVNIKLCFPNLSVIEQQDLLRQSFESVGIGLFETALAWFASDKRIRKIACVVNLENLVAAKANDAGVLVTAAHFTHIELSLRIFSFCTPVSVMYRPQKNKLFEWVLQKCRARYVQEGIHRDDIRGMLRVIRKKETAVVYTADQDLGHHLGTIFAPFFGVTASTVLGGNYLAKKTGCTVLPVFCHRNKTAKYYEVYILPPLENFPSGDNIVDATRTNKIIEEAILKAPEQYIWQHRRFKTRPPGEPGVYFKYSKKACPLPVVERKGEVGVSEFETRQ